MIVSALFSRISIDKHSKGRVTPPGNSIKTEYLLQNIMVFFRIVVLFFNAMKSTRSRLRACLHCRMTIGIQKDKNTSLEKRYA